MNREQNLRKKRIRTGFLLSLGFMAAWAVFSLINAVMPQKEMSVREKRALALFPEFTADSLLSGGFGEAFEEYAKDQILGRDGLAALNTSVSRLFGNVQSSGVWIGRDGWLLYDPEVWDGNGPPAALQGVNRLADEWGFDVTLAVIPEAAEILPSRLPWAADGEALAKRSRASWETLLDEYLSSAVRNCDVSDALTAASAETDVYYRTDHHWTTAGAMAALPVILEPFEETPAPYELVEVCGGFRGTLAASSGVYSTSDRIMIPVPADRPEEPVTVRVDGEDGLRTSVYRADELYSGDPYRVFMGGNYGKYTVTTGEPDKGRLLVLKDSYFNCLLPMLLPHFSEIVVVDPRYYDEDPVLLLLSMKDARVLVCCSRATFLTDQSLGRLVPERTEGGQ